MSIRPLDIKLLLILMNVPVVTVIVNMPCTWPSNVQMETFVGKQIVATWNVIVEP